MNLFRDRSKRYETLLDSLPRWSVILILVLVLVLLGVMVIVSLFGSPDASVSYAYLHTDWSNTTGQNYTSLNQVFHGEQPIVDIFTDISIYSMEFKYIIRFNPIDKGNNTFGGIIKTDLKLKTLMYGRDADDEEWTLINSAQAEEEIERTLTCAQLGYVGPISYSGCYPITLLYSRVIRYSQYKMVTYVLNLESVHHAGLLEEAIKTSLEANNPSYSSYEMGFRMTFSVLALLHWISFFAVTIWSQQWARWQTIQKWLVFLLFLHIWYHDPLYPAMMYTGWEGFPIVDIILSISFVYGFLLYLLIFFHSLFKPPATRTFLNFYLTKILIVGVAYVLTMIILIWSRVYNVANPSSVDVASIPGYVYLIAANAVFLVLWGVDLAYYIFRSLGAIGKMRKKYSSRFRVIGSFSFIVAASFIGVTIAGNGFRTEIQSLTFLLLHGIVYLYFACLSILMMPGRNEEAKPEIKRSDEVSSHDNMTSDAKSPTDQPQHMEDDDEVQITDVVLSRNEDDEHV